MNSLKFFSPFFHLEVTRLLTPISVCIVRTKYIQYKMSKFYHVKDFPRPPHIFAQEPSVELKHYPGCVHYNSSILEVSKNSRICQGLICFSSLNPHTFNCESKEACHPIKHIPNIPLGLPLSTSALWQGKENIMSKRQAVIH